MALSHPFFDRRLLEKAGSSGVRDPAPATRPQQQKPVENEDEWEYEYSTTETETYYLTLDISVRDFLERRPDDIIHNTRGGYRVWYNPLFNAPEQKATNPELIEDQNQDGELPEREEAEPEHPIDPMLEESVNQDTQPRKKAKDGPPDEIQILELHSNEPIISYRNHVFRGAWYENIGTEMIFTAHEDQAELPALRNLGQGIDLLAASAARINFREATLIPKDEIIADAREAAQDEDRSEDELPERYKRNGGIYIHIGGDKSGQRQPQAHFLEDLIALKRKRGEKDEVTVQPLETRHNQLMVEDEEEERRRKKLATDQARAFRWREIRRGEGETTQQPVESTNYVPRKPTVGRGLPAYLRRATVAAASLATVVFLLWLLPRLLNPTPPDADERRRDQKWVDSSPYWIDRQACRWLSLCGVAHLRYDAPAIGSNGTGEGGDLRMELLRLFALGLSAERTVGGVMSWENAPVRQDLKRRRRGVQAADGARILEEIPDYVLDHAPLVHLYSGEHFWPADIAEHVKHMLPYEGGELVDGPMEFDLNNLSRLNAVRGTKFLTSVDDVETRPEWLHSHVGIPVPFDDDDDDGDDGHGDETDEEPGWRDPRKPTDGTTWWDADRTHPPHRISDPRRISTKQRRPLQKRRFDESQRPIIDTPSEPDSKPDPSGHSKAPAVLVLVDKGAGIVDAFWFFFYSYNLGQTVLNIRFGNHVGDWEHCMTRFEHGEPRAMFLSEHAGGKAYAWKALEKRKQKGADKPARPVIYSAVGSHAMYANSGLHPYVLPFKMLRDVTDEGPIWDPTLNNYAYWFDYEVDREESSQPPGQDRTGLVPASSNPDAPTSWFHFEDYWGDDVYLLNDKRQWRLFDEYHYTTGPQGPKAKSLDRRKVCPGDKCVIVDSIEAGKKSAWY
ncbi:hypothetical protein B0H67DRAFT_484031 [Lasiosphaeris hirsuta]|uniref:Transcription factor TFIIIC triple barrel domain-containing protein n=1 Tax=Lasiosphaeris hirsuta TaxID=260670 RepID=A0AA40DYE3_9PEZI|nr:hypothetical protein B0H67DRAFT_484031 [Lasiosphaeris hirsuta]